MKGTLHCPGILGQASYSLQNMFKFLSYVIILHRVMGIFRVKIAQKCILRGQIQ